MIISCIYIPQNQSSKLLQSYKDTHIVNESSHIDGTFNRCVFKADLYISVFYPATVYYKIFRNLGSDPEKGQSPETYCIIGFILLSVLSWWRPHRPYWVLFSHQLRHIFWYTTLKYLISCKNISNRSLSFIFKSDTNRLCIARKRWTHK